jgi:hypothetical protein
MLDICRRIYREKDGGRLARDIIDLQQILQRKVDSLSEKREA